jgi:hypothetical protein
MIPSKQRWLTGLFQFIQIEVRPTKRDAKRNNAATHIVSFAPIASSRAYEAFLALLDAHARARETDGLEAFYRRLIRWARRQ